MARKSAVTPPAEAEQTSGRKYIKMDDLPGPDDILGIFGVEGKTYQFVAPMLCGASDYVMLRERMRGERMATAMVTPLASQVYYAQRVSAIGSNAGAPKSVKSDKVAPKTQAMSQTPVSAPRVTAPATPAKPGKRPRGRPRKLAS